MGLPAGCFQGTSVAPPGLSFPLAWESRTCKALWVRVHHLCPPGFAWQRELRQQLDQGRSLQLGCCQGGLSTPVERLLKCSTGLPDMLTVWLALTCQGHSVGRAPGPNKLRSGSPMLPLVAPYLCCSLCCRQAQPPSVPVTGDGLLGGSHCQVGPCLRCLGASRHAAKPLQPWRQHPCT